MNDNSVPQSISYGDLDNLSSALATAVSSNFMSLEEGRAIWKKHLVKVGWKEARGTTTKELKAEPKPEKGGDKK